MDASSRGGANRLFHCLDFYHTSPISGERQYKSRAGKRRFDHALRICGPLRGSQFVLSNYVPQLIWSLQIKRLKVDIPVEGTNPSTFGVFLFFLTVKPRVE